jgi:hypothetical protein
MRALRFYTAMFLFMGTYAYCGTASTPQSVVLKYCALDANGAQYDSTNPGAQAIENLQTDEYANGFDESTIIRSYRLGKIKIQGSRAIVEVIYEDLGVLTDEPKANKDSSPETVLFHLVRLNGQWRIARLSLMPHLSKSWILSQLRGDGQQQTAHTHDEQIQKAIDEISNW